MTVVRKVAGAAGHYGTQLKVLAGAGIIRPYSPVVLARMARTLKDWGPGLAGGFTTLAIRAPQDVGGRLDVTKGWTLSIPAPDETRGTYAAAIDRQSGAGPASSNMSETR